MKITYEGALILTVIVLIGGLILLNDLFFSRRRKSIKIFEFLFFFLMFLFMIISTRNIVLYKQNEFKQEISKTEVARQMGESMTIYDEFGNPSQTTIGEFIKGMLISPVISRESNSTPQERLRNNVIVGSAAAIYFVYWLVLLLLYEKEEPSGYHVVETEKLFEKYNPIAAACLVQNRNVMTRDMIAELLHLISVGKVNLRIVPEQSEKLKLDQVVLRKKTKNLIID